ncbi:MAG: MTAP family purine nucleoside phosphorylase [Gammaproteobacteria bacterium WSBS_2016_MAG_OTU1]
MLAIIGGSGFYQLAGAKTTAAVMTTPFGEPSAAITTLTDANGNQALFLPRHGDAHQLLPSEINYRANIWALKKAGARQIIGVSACGSLRQEIHPGDFIIPSQYFDNTRGVRVRSFYGDGLVGHISSATPACPVLSAAVLETSTALNFAVHADKTYACVEGPRLGTRAESFFLRDAVKADIVGMTNAPEVFLAMEAQICYVTLAICTDYDCWQDDPAEHATLETIIARFGDGIARARQVVEALIATPPPVNEEHRRAAAGAVMTPLAAQTAAHRELLEVLLA